MRKLLRFTILVLLTPTLLLAQQNSAKTDPSKQVAEVNGGAGPCSIEITVFGVDAKPVYGATVKVHIAYGFGGFHRLDLSAGTNSAGKVKFTGLPSSVHRPPLEFDASKGDLTGMLTYDPEAQCHATQSISLLKSAPQAQ